MLPFMIAPLLWYLKKSKKNKLSISFLFPFYSGFLNAFPKNPNSDKPNNYDSNTKRCSIWRRSCKKNGHSYYYRYDAKGISHDY